jgi:hypothetical protein
MSGIGVTSASEPIAQASVWFENISKSLGYDAGVVKQIFMYSYCASGQYPSPCFLFKTHNVAETGFCLRLQVRPTQLGPIDRASPCLRISHRNVVRFK